MNLCVNIGAVSQDIQAELVILRENAYAQRKIWRNTSVIQMKKVRGTRRNTPFVLVGVSSKENNLAIVTPMLRNAYVQKRHLEPATPNALTTQSAVCGVRLRKGRRRENVKESITGIVFANRHPRMQITRLNDPLAFFTNQNNAIT